jgi:hypothetical protein
MLHSRENDGTGRATDLRVADVSGLQWQTGKRNSS